MDKAVRDSADEVMRVLGPGHGEVVYRNALAIELRDAGFGCQCEVPMPVHYKGQIVACGFADVVVTDGDGGRMIVELKAVVTETSAPAWKAQLRKYVRSDGDRGVHATGMVVNFVQREEGGVLAWHVSK